MASTSSLEFLGCTVSRCSTGCCCAFCDCPDRSCAFVGSGAGGGLCARAVPSVNVPRSADLMIRRRISCMTLTSACTGCLYHDAYKRSLVAVAMTLTLLLG